MRKLMNKLYSPIMLSLCMGWFSIFNKVHTSKHSFILFGEPEYKED